MPSLITTGRTARSGFSNSTKPCHKAFECRGHPKGEAPRGNSSCVRFGLPEVDSGRRPAQHNPHEEQAECRMQVGKCANVGGGCAWTLSGGGSRARGPPEKDNVACRK